MLSCEACAVNRGRSSVPKSVIGKTLAPKQSQIGEMARDQDKSPIDLSPELSRARIIKTVSHHGYEMATDQDESLINLREEAKSSRVK